MTQMRETRRAGGATGFGKLSFPGGIDNRDLKPNRAALQARKRLRRQRLVEHLPRLGLSPLGHFLREIEAGANVAERLALPSCDGGEHERA
jgi:hypothetical protein